MGHLEFQNLGYLVMQNYSHMNIPTLWNNSVHLYNLRQCPKDSKQHTVQKQV